MKKYLIAALLVLALAPSAYASPQFFWMWANNVPTAPPIPTGHSLVAGTLSVTLHPGTSAGATSFNYYLKAGADPTTSTYDATGTATDGQVISSLTAGTVYHVGYTAANSYGTSSLSTIDTATPTAVQVLASNGTASSAGTYVSCGNGSSLQITGAISLWVNMKHLAASYATPIYKGYSDGTWVDYGTQINTAGNVLLVLGTGHTTYQTFTSTATISTTADHKIVWTWDGTTSANAVKLYIDNSLSQSFTSAQTTIQNAAYGLYVASMGPTTNYNDTNGDLWECAVYNRALTSTEATTTGAPPSSGAKGIWLLHEGTGTTANDTSGNGNTGTITNGSWVTQP